MSNLNSENFIQLHSSDNCNDHIENLAKQDTTPNITSSDIISKLYDIINKQIDHSKFLVYNQSFELHYDKSDSYIIPDIAIVCKDNDKKNEIYYNTPKFIINVFNGNTSHKNYRQIIDLYQKAAVPEYVVINFKKRTAYLYTNLGSSYRMDFYTHKIPISSCPITIRLDDIFINK